MFPIDFCHIPVSIIKRSAGRSAVAAAAYRSGTKLTNEWDGMIHDYTRKGGIVHAEIMLPAHAPAGICRPFYPLEQRGANRESKRQPACPRD
ncbi:MAG: MobA/MobL family protein [Ruminococcus sp.]